jgi:hypothetical protein
LVVGQDAIQRRVVNPPLEFGHSLGLDMRAKECFTSNSETEGGRTPTRQAGG